MKIFYTLFFLIMFLGSQLLHGMSMAPMPMQDEDAEWAEIFQLKIEVERKRMRERQALKSLRDREDCLVGKVLASHADLNAEYSLGRLLELVTRAKSLNRLLQHGADPRQCRRSILVQPILYYLYRIDESDPLSPPNHPVRKAWRARVREDQDRRVMKIFDCVRLLLRSGADANTQWNGMLPLHTILRAGDDRRLSGEQRAVLSRWLIWRGADPRAVEPHSGISANWYVLNRSLSWRCFGCMDEQRRMYEAVCQILKGHKEEDSPLSMTPLEVVHKIIGYVVRGGFPPPQRRAITSSVTSSAATDISHEQPEAVPSLLALPMEEQGSDIDDTSAAVPVRSARWRSMMGTKLFVVAAVSGTGWWAFKKWRKYKKAKEKRRQELWDKYCRNRIAY